MKRLLPLLLIASLLLALSGCTFREDTPATPNATTESTLALPPAESVAPTVPATTVPPTQATIPTEAAFTPYLVKISRADFPIHRGPGYDYDVARTIGAAGTFTIVEESVDEAGNLWGKLKSGAGWVDFTRNEKESKLPVTVARADKALLDSGNYYYCEADTSEYAYLIALRANTSLQDVSFFTIATADGYSRGSVLYHIPNWDTGKPLVVSVSFPGPAVLYGLEFTDSTGTHTYTVWESGMDGSVGISPLTEPLN